MKQAPISTWVCLYCGWIWKTVGVDLNTNDTFTNSKSLYTTIRPPIKK